MRPCSILLPGLVVRDNPDGRIDLATLESASKIDSVDPDGPSRQNTGIRGADSDAVDIDGDGRRDLVLGSYNLTGDTFTGGLNQLGFGLHILYGRRLSVGVDIDVTVGRSG